MRKRLLGLIGLGAACAACCMPLVPTMLAAIGIGAVLDAKVGSVSLDYLICTYGPWLALGCAAALIFMATRKRSQPACNCETSCKV